MLTDLDGEQRRILLWGVRIHEGLRSGNQVPDDFDVTARLPDWASTLGRRAEMQLGSRSLDALDRMVCRFSGNAPGI